jgi:hypothetical protein
MLKVKDVVGCKDRARRGRADPVLVLLMSRSNEGQCVDEIGCVGQRQRTVRSRLTTF